MNARLEQSRAVLGEVTAAAHLSSTDAEPIRLGENDLWRLPGGIVVRIARPGQDAAAAREVAVTRWLSDNHFPAVRPLPIDQPIHAGGRVATLWEELPPHRAGTTDELAVLLRQLHALPVPCLCEGQGAVELGLLDPFVRLADRIRAVGAETVTDDVRGWLLDRLEVLRHEWGALPDGMPKTVIHGDAWRGNVAATTDRAYLLDFERTSLGPPEWDLASTAVGYDSAGSISRKQYERFVASYGFDVMTWSGYATLRSIRELRLVTFALQLAPTSQQAAAEAHYRLACLRGAAGPRPWHWSSIT
ncbi:aminoglycoside phosphotransferase family protein [Streptomyces sp. RFCAC02]|uniref:phosphotransferase family protein n=1 Tax=Streptomyces sp. RFCAC02 TaxID=2499143 RepID=UPI00101FE491|nr:aminoglycoside phosphotransferase family protein [Streptomyces sp. RFCAC02]